mgnify:CR=1 FL=1
MKSKTQKREEAQRRAEARETRSDAEQLALLNERPGTAGRERRKIVQRAKIELVNVSRSKGRRHE